MASPPPYFSTPEWRGRVVGRKMAAHGLLALIAVSICTLP
jgi:hypothetical protein